MTYLFLDTMIYLHYTWFEDIDWKGVVGDQKVQIVVPHITLQELDDHKDNHKIAKIRERARKVAARLLECFLENGGTLKGSLTASEFDESPVFDFTAHNLDKTKNDHRLLAAILQFKDTCPESVVLITQDVGPRLKANRLGIDAKALPETCRLPSEEDPLTAENKRLNNELLKIKSAMPKLSLGSDGMNGGHIELAVTPPADVIDINQQMYRVRTEFPRKGKPQKNTGSPVGSIGYQFLQNTLPEIAGMSQISESEYDRYNRDCDEYFEQCETYFIELKKYQLQCRAELNLFVSNDGGAPAEDVDVFTHFPDGFELFTKNNLPKEPTAPRSPQQPRNVIQMSMGGRVFDAKLNLPDYIHEIARPSSVDSFSIKKTNSYEIEDSFRRIKHGQVGVIRPLVVVFDSYESATSFQITYSIHAANLPEPVKGELNIVVMKSEERNNAKNH